MANIRIQELADAVAELTQNQPSAKPRPSTQNASGLYVIACEGSSGPLYWACSSDHGAGWVPHQPKQAFSKSELIEAIRRMIYEGYWISGAAIKELQIM